mmetsp:Transcript_119929/g.382871  ORF Transcript_119929/g.382871 Transcript_119929/m.382871 type:complete len:456 (-) Transcript_119929:42-1409(-)|eukprot:CAMPEP_0203843264 /NCGR_PEP_ID=MMETSP0359-20131031/2501_1 /ASSEMBLY_ACC=CAM_ASM_000338 /TAXON_ID=268821 /ORGANISM="Scrippsiella Hangoei, Strain SHTV-5" /LENGTH=455 /DNA_ID=CAMNT_0050758021 /DNA_START=35 /DNA_END=1402 /DNA_ORIENTATION=+
MGAAGSQVASDKVGTDEVGTFWPTWSGDVAFEGCGVTEIAVVCTSQCAKKIGARRTELEKRLLHEEFRRQRIAAASQDRAWVHTNTKELSRAFAPPASNSSEERPWARNKSKGRATSHPLTPQLLSPGAGARCMAMCSGKESSAGALAAELDAEADTPGMRLSRPENGAQDGGLNMAAVKGNLATVQRALSKNGAGKDAALVVANPRGTTSLMLACTSGEKESPSIVRELLQRKADVAARDYQGWTCYHHACRAGYEKVVAALVNGGAKVHERTNDDKNAMMLASQGGYHDVLTYLVEMGDDTKLLIKAKDNDGFTALHFASKKGSQKCCMLLLKKGSAANGRSNDGITPLMWAGAAGQVACIKLLVGRKARVDDVDLRKQSCVFWACSSGQDNAATVLLKCKANLTVQNDDGETPLSLAQALHMPLFLKEAKTSMFECELEKYKQHEVRGGSKS